MMTVGPVLVLEQRPPPTQILITGILATEIVCFALLLGLNLFTFFKTDIKFVKFINLF